MFADSSRKFQMKVRFNLSKAKLSQFIFLELLSGDAVDLVQGHPTDRFGKLSVRKTFNPL